MVFAVVEFVDATLPLLEGFVVDVWGFAWVEVNWLAALDNTAVTPLQAESNITEMMRTLVRLTKFFFMVSSINTIFVPNLSKSYSTEQVLSLSLTYI